MKLKECWRLYRLVSKTKDLGLKRHVMYEQNKAMKWLGYLFAAFWCAYLMFFGVLLGKTMNGSMEGFDMINGILIFFLIADFLFRLMLTDTPAQEIKPYKMLPVSMKFLLNVFLILRSTSAFNYVWLFFLVPFGLFQLPHYYGLSGYFVWLLAWWLIVVANAYWYLLWRTVLNRNMVFLAIPLAIYAVVAYFGVISDDVTKAVLGDNTEWLFYGSLRFFRQVLELRLWPFIVIAAVIAILYYVDYIVQRKCVYFELAEVHEAKVKSREMVFLNRFGIIGEYLKLEIKSIMRNGTIRKQFTTGFLCMLMLTFINSFTGTYDNSIFMKAYISMYCYSVLGVVLLTSVMSAEGNYIDGLMARKESILSLLKAKYYFHLMMMLVPFVVFMVPVIQGKSTFHESVGCLLFTAGFVLPGLFQMAVYNDMTMNLNAKITRAGRSNKTQMIVSLVALFVPMFIMYGLLLLDSVVSSVCMSIIGIIGIALNPLWLRNVYNRFMARRYKNMDGFRSSKNF